MQFPKKLIDTLNSDLAMFQSSQCPEQHVEIDPKDLADLITYAELANARIKELENDCSGLMFKLRCVAQALK